MKRRNREIGYAGEETAVKYLQAQGCQIIARNFATKSGEIDIIYQDKGTLVFAEVKTKTSGSFGVPEEMFTRWKYERVKRIATAYLKGNEIPCRIDMIAVLLDRQNQREEVRLYKNVTFTG